MEPLFCRQYIPSFRNSMVKYKCIWASSKINLLHNWFNICVAGNDAFPILVPEVNFHNQPSSQWHWVLAQCSSQSFMKEILMFSNFYANVWFQEHCFPCLKFLNFAGSPWKFQIYMANDGKDISKLLLWYLIVWNEEIKKSAVHSNPLKNQWYLHSQYDVRPQKLLCTTIMTCPSSLPYWKILFS